MMIAIRQHVAYTAPQQTQPDDDVVAVWKAIAILDAYGVSAVGYSLAELAALVRPWRTDDRDPRWQQDIWS